jgi:hypothetical protein
MVYKNGAGAAPTTPSCSSICATGTAKMGCLPSSCEESARCNAPAAAPSGRPLDATTAASASTSENGVANLCPSPLIPLHLRSHLIPRPYWCLEAQPPLLHPQRHRQTTQQPQPAAPPQPSPNRGVMQPRLPVPPLQLRMPPSLRQPTQTPWPWPTPHPQQPWPIRQLLQPHPCTLR